jgi:hypothetical protein
MKFIRLVIICQFLTLASAFPMFAKEWRDIVPLRSTRADVERLLGKPQTGSRGIYRTENERISVSYSDGPCGYYSEGWKVPLDTVVSLTVYPNKPLKFADLKLDETKYEKQRDYHVEFIYYYTNKKEGITYTVEVGEGLVTGIEYFPQANDNDLRCPQTAPNNSFNRSGISLDVIVNSDASRTFFPPG